ncbi:hypothetical protein, partial [Glutamicibacter soli]
HFLIDPGVEAGISNQSSIVSSPQISPFDKSRGVSRETRLVRNAVKANRVHVSRETCTLNGWDY